MKRLRKILIASLVLIIIGALGLFITIAAGNIITGSSNFGAGRGHNFCPEDMGHRSWGSLQGDITTDLSFEDIDMDITEDGGIAGMLSVNGYTGDVWYHNWHGIFIDMTEEH